MKFTKMHGIGNDYVYVDGFAEREAIARIEKLSGGLPKFATAIADRHLGVGGDGLILVLPSKVADVRMRMFNADGSESEMCGNGVRCVAKLAFDHKLSSANPMKVETGRGVLTLSLDARGGKVERVTVDMGEPILNLAEIPVDASRVHATGMNEAGKHEYRVSDQTDFGEDEFAPFNATFVSMGNPHVVAFVPSLPEFEEIRSLGSKVEHADAFPRRINAHWVEVKSRGEVAMRTWERGSGITLACGTGACAVCVAGVLTGRTDRKILAHLPGGDLELEWRESDGHVYMTGPATEVFAGEWPSANGA